MFVRYCKQLSFSNSQETKTQRGKEEVFKQTLVISPSFLSERCIPYINPIFRVFLGWYPSDGKSKHKQQYPQSLYTLISLLSHSSVSTLCLFPFYKDLVIQLAFLQLFHMPVFYRLMLNLKYVFHIMKIRDLIANYSICKMLLTVIDFLMYENWSCKPESLEAVLAIESSNIFLQKVQISFIL